MVGFLEQPGTWHQTPEDREERALAWARRNKARLLAGPEKALTLEPFLEGFYSPSGAWATRMTAKGHSLGRKYLLTRQGHLDNYIKPLFGKADPRELTARHIDDVLLAARRSSGAPEPLAPATKYKLLYSFALVLEDLREQGLIAANPLSGIKAYSKAPVAPRSAIPREALGKIFPPTHGGMVRTWGSSMWASAMLVLLDTGMRPGELRALRWRELRADRSIVVRHGIEAGTRDVVKGTKTGFVKPAFLSRRTAQELEIWRAESPHSGADDFVFTITGERPVTNEAIVQAFRRGIRAHGIDATNWTPYWLRHTFGTYSLDALEDSELLLLMGHTNVATNAIYRHPDDDQLVRRASGAQAKLEAAREKKSPGVAGARTES